MEDIVFTNRTIHICRNVVKVSREDIVVKSPQTASGDRYVYFSKEMESLLKEFQRECAWKTDSYDERELTDDPVCLPVRNVFTALQAPP